MREVPFVFKADDLALATSHLAQSSSASRFSAGAYGFFILSQSGERPERYIELSDYWRGGALRRPDIYSSSAANTLPVLGLTMWTCPQAKQATPSYVSVSSWDPLSANQPCTRWPVAEAPEPVPGAFFYSLCISGYEPAA